MAEFQHDPLASAPAPLTQSVAELSKSEDEAPGDVPVTILVSRRVRRGCEAQFEACVRELSNLLQDRPGFTDIKAYAPGAPDDEHKVVLCFKSAHDLEAWQQCEARGAWLERVKPLEEAPPRAQVLTGMEGWFTLPTQEGMAPPPRHRMAVVTWLGIFPMLTLVNLLLVPRLEWMSPVVRSALTSAMMVTLMTFVIMPRLTRACAKWLYPEIELPNRREGNSKAPRETAHSTRESQV